MAPRQDFKKYNASTLSDWSFRQFHLAADRGGKNQGQFMTPEATLIAAGPARLEDLAGGGSIDNAVVPIAITDNLSVNQNKMLQQIFEVGSRRSYFVSGHTTGNVAISRPMFNGPSLMRVLTAKTQDHAGLDNTAGLDTVKGGDPAILNNGAYSETDEASLYVNLQAEIFDRPLGLMVYMIDQRNVPYGAFYIEDCNVQAHGMGIASQAMTIVENVSCMFDRIVPVAVTSGG
jgi:hypothetical protein